MIPTTTTGQFTLRSFIGATSLLVLLSQQLEISFEFVRVKTRNLVDELKVQL